MTYQGVAVIAKKVPTSPTFVDVTITGRLHLNDDIPLQFGNTLAAPDAKMLWETADADANLLLLALPTKTAVNVPGFVVGDVTALDVDLGLFGGFSNPFIAVLSDDATKSLYLEHNGTNGFIRTTSGQLILASVTGDVNIGDATTAGELWFNTPAAGSAKFIFREGSTGSGELYMNFSGTFDQFSVTPGATAGNQWVFGSIANRNTDFDHPSATDFTLYIHSDVHPDVDNTSYGYIKHDQTDFVIGQGTGTTKLSGGQTWNITTVSTATYDLLISDMIVHVTYTVTGAVTSLTLPSAQTLAGRVIVIKDAGANAGTNNITIDTEGAETIDGAATAVIAGDNDSVSLYSDGSDWFIF